MPKKLSRIFVAGTGSIREVRPAIEKSERLGRNRAFTVTGKEIRELRKVKPGNVFDAQLAVAKAFGGRPPLSLMVAEECATKALLSTAPGSQNIIFASYLANNLASDKLSCILFAHTCYGAFFRAAKSRLVPGGRLILVQDKAAVPDFRKDAKDFGFEFHAIEIPEQAAKRSSAVFIRIRSTPARRIAFMNKFYSNLDPATVKKLIRQGAISSKEEYTKPVAMIMKKPRKAKEREAEDPVYAGDLLRDVERILGKE